MSKGNHIEVVIENLKNHPQCPHGPTILFSREFKGEKRRFFACAACRDRKQCSFFLWENERNKISGYKKSAWEQERKKFLKNINHRRVFLILNKVHNINPTKRIYCQTCSEWILENYENKHTNHKLLRGITDYQLNRPSEILAPLENTKKEAQYLFAKSSIETLVNIFRDLEYKNIICIGTPRFHEHIRNKCEDMTSLLLDIDSRFHNFFGPLEYCWYNSFNHHFFSDEGRNVFEDFLKSNKGKDMALIMDPPFGGRVELLASTLVTINEQYKSINKLKNNIPMFWVFPYFMEPQISNRLTDFKMLDYKVEYDNHLLFQNGPKGRKQGSPVRIFTNVDPRLIKLWGDGYKYCKLCSKWVSEENNHCELCNSCTSKDGRTYIHCSLCNRCVKPTWKHCNKCGRCAQVDHKCGEIEFSKDCFHCKKSGHKKSDCPQLKNLNLIKKTKKRKKSTKERSNKKMSIKNSI